MFDVIIKNGRIIDGTGLKAYKADLAVKDGKIALIGRLDGATAPKILDAAGCVVTPGFIDMHSHGDLTCFIYPKHESNLRQGVTSFAGGNCGVSLAPLTRFWSIVYIDLDILDTDSALGFDRLLPLQETKEKFEAHFGVTLDWETFPQYMESLARREMASNLIPFMGHGQLRAQVLGQDYKRPAHAGEIIQMRRIVAEAMDAGAFGFSSGMDYAPGIYADAHELAELTEPVAERNGLYLTHWKRTGMRQGTPKPHRKIDGIIEQLDIAGRYGVKLHLGHLSPGYDVFPRDNQALNRAVALATTQVIDVCRDKGSAVTFDVIPNTTGGLGITPHLSAHLSKWLHENGGSAKKLSERLKDPAYKKSVADTIKAGKFYALNPIKDPEWEDSMTVIRAANPEHIGKTLKELAREQNKNSVEALLDLVAEDYAVKVDVQAQSLDIPKALLEHPEATPSSDAVITDLQGPWRSSDEVPGAYPTPNGFCYSVKFLKEFEHASLEEAIRKLTGKAADILGLSDRGYLKTGTFADIAVFNPEVLETNENHAGENAFAEGMKHVLVNGIPVMENGELTGNLPGRVIRKTG